MLRRFLTSKIHLATVTSKDVNYEGSLGLDQNIIDAAGLQPYEMVYVFNVNNGNRFETYLIPYPRGSYECQLNGAAARLGEIKDRLIILAFGLAEEPVSPRIVLLDENNRIIKG